MKGKVLVINPGSTSTKIGFYEDGQLWGNPIYDYKKMEKDGYTWWVQRMKVASKIFDTVRIDHFRAFSSYWAVPYEDETAKNGKWEMGPGKKLYDKLAASTNMEMFVEDLGILTDDVIGLKKKLDCAGMKVMQFAFDSDWSKMYLPHNYEKNCVAYIGTHDNNTFRGYLEEAGLDKQKMFADYVGASVENLDDIIEKTIRSVVASPANLAIITIQDILGLDSKARMNIPGTMSGNWLFQLKDLCFDKKLEELSKLVEIYERY